MASTTAVRLLEDGRVRGGELQPHPDRSHVFCATL